MNLHEYPARSLSKIRNRRCAMLTISRRREFVQKPPYHERDKRVCPPLGRVDGYVKDEYDE